jgi:hypothetical protein
MEFKGEGLRKVLIVSEYDWHNEHHMMDRLIQRSGGLDRSHFYFASLKSPNLLQRIKDHDIKTVVGMGETVLRQLTGEKDILRWRGRTLDWMGRHFVPTFAPHKLLPENPNAQQQAIAAMQGIRMLVNPPRFQGTWMLDVEYAIKVAREGFKRRPGNYIVDPTVTEFERWAERYFAALAANSDLYLSWDIETPYKMKKGEEGEFEESEFDNTILRISFSFEEYTGVSVPWSPAYLGVIQRLLRSAGPKVVWNGLTFDIPVVNSVGVDVQGDIYDYMDGWHLYQSDLPKGLEFVTSFTSDLLPWKHLNNSDPGIYSAIDSDAALRNANWLRTKLKATGQWDTFLNHYVRLMPAMHTAGKQGNHIDMAVRDALKIEMADIMDSKVAEMQPLVPDAVKPRKRYKRKPEGLVQIEEGLWRLNGRTFEPVTVQGKVKFCSVCHERDVKKGDHFKGGKKNPCKANGGEIVTREAPVVEWDEILDFNPNSGDQLKEYAKFHGHPVGENKRDSTKEAMDAQHLKTLKKTYSDHSLFYGNVLEIKKLSKTLGTYIYTPDEFGLIHTTYKNAPSTPRFSSANVNLQNVGKRADNPWATKARMQIVARPGRRFVQADSSAIEALIQGWWMGDEQYMLLSTQSVHAWVVAKMHGIKWVGSEEQVSFLKENYKADYDKMKTTNYLTNFGGGDYLLWKTFPDVFPSRAAAKEAQDNLYAMLPKLKEYHHWVRTKAQKESYLELPGWKHRHYFYDVFTVDPSTGKVKYGKDAKRCVAFFPQGCAAAFMRDNALLLAYGDRAAEWLGIEPLGLGDGYLRWFPANFVVHDGYTLEPEDGYEDEAAEALEKVLTRPIPQLANLRVGAEVDISPVGGNWAPFHEKKNPQGLKTVKTIRVPVVPPPSAIRLAA